MFSGIRADSNRSAMEIREAAALRQQRRIKQAVQFLHKDSADLLPLDGLKKLGTSKEGQPHNILQRRLLEANLSRNRLNNRGVKPSYNSQALSRPLHNDTQEEESDLIRVVCQCLGKEVTVMLNTGCVVNLISSVSVEKLGLKEKVIQTKNETDLGPFQRNLQTVGHIELNLNFGQTKAECTFTVIENDRPCISIGTKTLKSLKCVIDTEKQMLVLGKDTREQIQFTGASHETEG
ncbi:nuclear receptor-interacting protein 3-like [Chanos chanos]|uniref:Nuclear receptor-interacting protein 3-like n=1 Tax=Chanos chanos TaxID=29144 RepID=A0A6J2WPY6_CHACN|nr:nuclear receptor-interacting protein 3 [Chanos chanos]